MRKNVNLTRVIATLREARKRTLVHCMPQHSPGDRTGAIFELSLITGLFMEAFGIKSGTPEANRILTRIWGLTGGPNSTTKVTKETVQIQQESNEYVTHLQKQAARACTCDGGGTICGACWAERQLKKLEESGTMVVPRTSAEVQCP